MINQLTPPMGFLSLQTRMFLIAMNKQCWGLHPIDPMNNILTWNVRGLNRASKQHEVSQFIRYNNVSLFAHLETKVKHQGLA